MNWWSSCHIRALRPLCRIFKRSFLSDWQQILRLFIMDISHAVGGYVTCWRTLFFNVTRAIFASLSAFYLCLIQYIRFIEKDSARRRYRSLSIQSSEIIVITLVVRKVKYFVKKFFFLVICSIQKFLALPKQFLRIVLRAFVVSVKLTRWKLVFLADKYLRRVLHPSSNDILLVVSLIRC